MMLSAPDYVWERKKRTIDGTSTGNKLLRMAKPTRTQVFSILCITFALTASAADENKGAAKAAPKAYLTVESAGQDYADQGEYSNDWGGAQVIALGEDKFRVVIHKGGLPGDGW